MVDTPDNVAPEPAEGTEQAPVEPPWQTDPKGRRYRVWREPGKRARVEYGSSGDRPPKPRKRAKPKPAGSGARTKPVAEGEPTTAMIENGLAQLLSMPSIPFAMQVAVSGDDPDPGAVFMVNHFTTQGPNLAHQLATYSERNPQLRRILIAALTGESIAALGLAVAGYAAPPLIYLLSPDDSPARKAFSIPPKSQPARVIVTPPPAGNGQPPPEAAPQDAHRPAPGPEPVPDPAANPEWPGGQSPQAPPPASN